MALIKPVKGKLPQLGSNCFLADNATVVGEVYMGSDCSVWFNAVVRADVCSIKIGDRTNIQDGVVIHGTYKKADVVIGNNVSIGHNAVVHGCTIHDNVLIGMNAVIMDDAVVHSNSVVAAGAIVLSGTIIESGTIYAGMPAKKVKEIGTDMEEVIARTAKNYPMYAEWFK